MLNELRMGKEPVWVGVGWAGNNVTLSLAAASLDGHFDHSGGPLNPWLLLSG
jgi:hypothetical protein